MRLLGRVLIVDDEKNLRTVLETILERAHFEVVSAATGFEALEYLKSEEFDAFITDLSLPDISGMELLKHCQKELSGLPVIMITAYGTIELAVQALKQGAFDFITKPFDQDELLQVVKKAIRTTNKHRSEPTPERSPLVNQSSQMREVLRMVEKVASSSTTVLITGESGTGKELVAYEIHRKSPRAAKPFVKINCSAIPATLIESELFGYEKGAFTGAHQAKPGRFELAHEGTLFLDEVAEMPPEMQAKLLRVIQEQEFERVGGVRTLKVDVRIITATNRQLEEAVKSGFFREDLYYRLNVVPIHLTPLRERAADLKELTKLFINEFNQKFNKKVLGLSPACEEAFLRYSWPGNIRQLENSLERMMLMCEREFLEPADLPDEILNSLPEYRVLETQSESTQSFKEIVKRRTQVVEKDLIEKALQEMGGNITQTAEKLGLSRKGLQLKMKELGIRRDVGT